MKSDCQHEWIKGRPPALVEMCMWCGIPKVRKAGPVPKIKMPSRQAEPRWLDLKSAALVRNKAK